MMSRNDTASSRWRIIIVVAVGIAVVLLLVWLIARLRPPTSMRLATGPEGEHEYQMALIYKEYMQAQGLDAELVPTAGSLETMALLQSGEVDAGFILNASNLELEESRQTSQSELSDGLVALAGVTHIPMWVFYRSELETDGPLEGFADLEGLRVALDEPGSGTRALARFLLRYSSIAEDSFEVVDASPRQSTELLLDGEIDAMFLSSGVLSQNVRDLLLAPDVEILNLRLATSYARMIDFVQHVDVLEGSIRIAENDPPEVKNLVTVASVLASREDLHPDLQLLLLRATIDAHGQTFDMFPSSEVFPDVEGLSLPVSPVTLQFVTEGQTILQRYLPFWIASPLERFYLLVVPIALLLFPLVRSTPGFYSFVMRRRINTWYKRIHQMELEIDQYTIAELDARLAELEGMDQEVTDSLKVSTGHLPDVYNLRYHISFTVEGLRKRRKSLEVHDDEDVTVEEADEIVKEDDVELLD
jgi:TRAP transporter TAXI family solute receptor